MTLTLDFEFGTIVAKDDPPEPVKVYFQFDKRSQLWRAPAMHYRDIVLTCAQNKIALHDQAKDYEQKQLTLKESITPREHQAHALKSWIDAGRKGVVQLPTGAGKTYLAVLAILKAGRSTLVVVPTIDLMHQWHDVLNRFFEEPIGLLGGGSKDVQFLTVATYDSAVLHVESIGNQFGLLVADEVHHLPAPQYQNVAIGCLAPFRLGLSATVERTDGKELQIYSDIGDLVYDGRIDQMASETLSPYDVVSVEIPLEADEQNQYDQARAKYINFVRKFRIDFSRPSGWSEFIQKSARFPGGKEAMAGYRDQKRLAQAATGKIRYIWQLLKKHGHQRMIIFTNDNKLAYEIGQTYFLPVLTHQTKIKERKDMLAEFREGKIHVIVTSKVLNEGVDVPEASVGVVVSGSGAVREHVQRLGRILRHQPGKRATLYEIIAKGTAEKAVNDRRKRHSAYKRFT